MLDDVKGVAALDRAGMLDAVGSMPEHLSEGHRLGRAAGRWEQAPCSVVVCGLGGSAIGGDALRAWLATGPGPMCEVVRGYSLPGHVDGDSLVIVASYSGNTEETLGMFDDAVAKGANVVTVSSGGRLAEMSESASVPSVRVPSGMVPRASFGYMFGAMLGVAERAGVAPSSKQVGESLSVMDEVIRTSGAEVPTVENPAKRLAHELHGRVPVIVGHGISAPVARRWATQMNENAKSLAFSSEIPEMDHNEIVPWAADPRSQGFSAVFLDHGFADRRMARRIGATVDIVRERSSTHVVKAIGRSPLAQMMSLVLTGDYTSVYAAVLRGEDPSTTEPIERLKAVLAEK